MKEGREAYDGASADLSLTALGNIYGLKSNEFTSRDRTVEHRCVPGGARRGMKTSDVKSIRCFQAESDIHFNPLLKGETQ